MQHISYITEGTCSRRIEFDIDEEKKLHNLRFTNGCSGNTQGVSRLCEGRDALEVADALEGTHCGVRATSCPDQLARAIRQAVGASDKMD